MTCEEVVAELVAVANAQTKKTWMNHGAQEPCLGVKIEDMKKMLKHVKGNHRLALELYDTGIADAMYFAGLFVDDAQMTEADLRKWLVAANSPWVSEFTVPWVAGSGPHGRRLALEWIESKDPKTAVAGWQTYASLASITPDADLDLDEIDALLKRVEKTIRDQPDRVRYYMNAFVTAIGCYVQPLHERALETARAVGKVSVKMPGSCKVPNSAEQIEKFAARGPVGRKRKSAKC